MPDNESIGHEHLRPTNTSESVGTKFQRLPHIKKSVQAGQREYGTRAPPATDTSESLGIKFQRLPHIKKPSRPDSQSMGHEHLRRRTRLRASLGISHWKRKVSRTPFLAADTKPGMGHELGRGSIPPLIYNISIHGMSFSQVAFFSF